MKSTENSAEEIFTKIFQTGAWRSRESASGPGSTVKITGTIRALIPDLIEKYELQTILDIPCGDFNWMKEVDLSSVNYLGADIVTDLVAQNNEKYSRDNTKFTQMDLTTDGLPCVDMIITRDCLVHLSFAECAQAVNNIKNSGSTYLLATTFPALTSNENIATGGFRKLNLALEPFNFPSPLELVSENHDVRSNPHKSLGLWNISQL
jgi:hypothetical protein